MKISRKLFIYPIAAVLFAHSFAEEYKMEDGVIKAKISYQHLNRISIKGDKLDSLVGVDTAFHVEKNDKTGEAYIRPTEDNGYSPISLSVTTLSGKTQDLLLEPVDGEANSIELVSESSVSEVTSLPSDFSIAEENIGSVTDYEETISAVMKKFINLPANQRFVEVRNVVTRTYQHLQAEFKNAYLVDGFLCLKFKVKTEKEGTFVLDERMFSKKGDIALSLSGLNISKSKTSILYVLRKS